MSSFAIHPIDPNEIAALLHGSHSDPFRVLGPHRAGDDLVIRIFRPEAKEIQIVAANDRTRVFPAERLHIEGLYQATVPNEARDFSYLVKGDRFRRLRATAARSLQLRPDHGRGGSASFRRGESQAALRKIRRASARRSAASAAFILRSGRRTRSRVSVVGDFNFWDGRVHPMRKLVGSGVWEIFMPGVKEGAHYKFEIRTTTRRASC